MPMTHITVYSDYVCPYCYMGYASLQQVAAEQPLDIEWRAYELRAGSEEPPPAYKARIEEHWPQTRRMAEEYGLDLRALRFGIDSRPAHQAYKIVQGLAPEQAAAFHEALFAGHWSGDYKISQHDDLVAIAESVGVDGAALRERLQAEVGWEEVRAETELAQQQGVSGVPAFIFDNQYLVSGTRPPDQLRAIIERVRELAEEGG